MSEEVIDEKKWPSSSSCQTWEGGDLREGNRWRNADARIFAYFEIEINFFVE